jgi:hypothetical protein
MYIYSYIFCTGARLLPPSDKSISVSDDDDDDDDDDKNNNNNNNVSIYYGHLHGVTQH